MTIIAVFAGLISMNTARAQDGRKLSVFLQPEYTRTLSDWTKGNNSAGYGIGFKANWARKATISLSLQVADDFLYDNDKVGYVDANGNLYEEVSNALKIFAGVDWNISPVFHGSAGVGPSFINGQMLASFKVGMGLYLGSSQRLQVSADYISILNRDSGVKQNFNSLVFSLGLRLF